MRFLHTADWHVGKKLNGFDLLAEQHDAFLKINQLVKDYKVDAVVVAGDLYDRLRKVGHSWRSRATTIRRSV